MNLIIRTHAPVATIAPMLRTVVTEIDRNQPIGAISAMEDVIAESVAPRRLNLWLVAAFVRAFRIVGRPRPRVVFGVGRLNSGRMPPVTAYDVVR